MNSNAEQQLTEYEKCAIIDMTKKVVDHLALKKSAIREKVGKTMGGRILDYEAKRILHKGIEQGIEQGKQQGIWQGETESVVALIAKKLRKQKTLPQIAEDLEMTPDELQEYYDAVMECAPDYDMEKIIEILKKQKYPEEIAQ